ncbi:MAG: efflux RND transporter periplasmic adaptor subunit [Candidatus Binatia bacterium]
MTILALLTTACESGYPVSAKQSPSSDDPPPQQVKTVTVEHLPLERTVTVLGSLAAYDQATLSAKVPGRIAELMADFGSLVEEGQALARIEQRDYQLHVQQAEAALAQARVRLGLTPTGSDGQVDPERTGAVRQARALLEDARQKRDRMAALVEKGFVAETEFDSADAAYKVALSGYQDAREEIRNRQALLMQRRAELDLARQRLADTVIHAPFDGVIQTKHASVGEYLDTSAPVFTLVRMDPLRLRAEVPERAAYKVKAGQKVRVTVEGNPNVYEGRLTRLGPTIDEQNRMLTVEADVRNPGALRPGSFVRIDIVTDEADQAITVPTSAIVSFAGVEKVFVVQDAKAAEKSITTGHRADDWTEVVAGLKNGDVVIVEPGNLRLGQTVSVVE